MAQTIKIKRSTGSAAPSTLAQGELAYSKGSDTFYVGDPAAANTPIPVGGAIKNNAGTPVLATGVTAAEIRTLIDVDQSGTDNSTNVSLSGAYDYLTLSGQAITLNQIDLTTDVTGTLPIGNGGTGATTASAARTALGVAIGSDVLAYDANLQSFVSTFTLPTTDGTSGQVIVTNGTGTLSFSTVSVTDTDVSVANLQTRLGEISSNTTIGDASDVQVTFAGGVVVTGNLTVNGTTTTVNSETLTIDDNIIVLNNNVTGTPTENAGIEIERGTSANVLVRWNETSDRWEFTNDGSTYQTIYSFNPDDTAFNIGANATSTGTSSVAIGSGADATATGALSLGVDSAAGGNNSVAVGANSNANNTNNVAVGYNSNAGGAGATSNVAIGGSATTNGSTRAVAIGDGADVASSSYSVAIGSFSSASSTYSTAIGYTAKADGIYSIGIGRDAQATGANTLVINASGATQTHSTAGEVFIGTDDGKITYDATNGWRFVEDASGTPVTYDLSSFGTGDGTVTSVGGTGSVNGITLSGTVTSSGNLTLGGSLSGITIAQLAGAAVITSAEAFSDIDTAVLTAAAVDDRILSYGYGVGDITSVQISSTDGSISGVGTGSTGAISFDLEVATIDGGTY